MAKLKTVSEKNYSEILILVIRCIYPIGFSSSAYQLPPQGSGEVLTKTLI